MSKFKKVPVNFQNLNGPEFIHLMSSTLTMAEQKALKFEGDPWVTVTLVEIKEKIQFLEKLLKEQKQEVTSKDLREADKKRDAAIRALINFFKLQLALNQPAKVTAAQHLITLTERYDGIISSKYEEQTPLVRSYIGKLDERENRSKIAALGAQDFVNNLKEAQDKFYQLYLQRIDQQNGQRAKTREQLTKDIRHLYSNLYDYLYCLVKFDANSPAKAYIEVFNDNRRFYHERDKKARKKVKKAKTEPVALLEEPHQEGE